MIQLQFRWRCTSCTRVFLACPSQVLLDGFVANGHLPGHGFYWHSGGIELQRTCLLLAEDRPVDAVVGGEDIGEAGGDPAPACGDLSDRLPYLAGVLVLGGISECAGAHRGSDGARLLGS